MSDGVNEAAAAPAGEKPQTRADLTRSLVGKIAGEVAQEHFGTGPLAELRRLDPNGSLSEPTLHRLLARHQVPEEWLAGQGLKDWALVIHCLALAAPDNLQGESRLGKALHDAGFGEKRFVNLLDATPQELRDLLPRAVRFLVARGGRLHPAQLAEFVLTPPAFEAPYEALRQRIAGDFYRAEHAASQPAAA